MATKSGHLNYTITDYTGITIIVLAVRDAQVFARSSFRLLMLSLWAMISALKVAIIPAKRAAPIRMRSNAHVMMVNFMDLISLRKW